MCGIAGVFNSDKSNPPIQKTELLLIRDAMISRGPDSSGLWISKNKTIGFAHRRLSIIDLSEAGAQPMHTRNGFYSIVFNGEIYNYRELRERLKSKGRQFHSKSDTEVLLHLYEEKGRAMIHDLRGMFAFAIWDSRKQGLFLVRDHFGVKPLYYSHEGGTFRFASQVKSLLAGGGIETTPDPAGRVGFFLLGSVPEPHTLFKEIRALPAGSTLWIDSKGNQNLEVYFSIREEYSKLNNNGSKIKTRDALDQLREGLLDSVRHHLVADVPVGVFLSSGLDSTTLAALASELQSSGLQTVTLSFKEYAGTENDESILAETVAKSYNTSHKTFRFTSDDFNTSLSHIFDCMDQPTIDGVNSYFVSKAAAQTGLKTALSGIGADEIFGGYPSFIQIPKIVDATRLTPFGRNFGKIFRWISAPMLKRLTSPKYAGIFEYGSSYGGAYLLRRGLFMPWELPLVLDEDMIKEGWRELQPLLHLEETTKNIHSKFLKISALEIEWYMRNQLLRDTDWAGMAHSLEIRTPFVDIELFRTVCSLHKNAFIPNKSAMAGTPKTALPNEVLTRPKTGFSIPVYQWSSKDQGSASCIGGPRDWAKKAYQIQTN